MSTELLGSSLPEGAVEVLRKSARAKNSEEFSLIVAADPAEAARLVLDQMREVGEYAILLNSMGIKIEFPGPDVSTTIGAAEALRRVAAETKVQVDYTSGSKV